MSTRIGGERASRELTVERGHEPRELQFVEIQVVRRRRTAQDRAIVEVVATLLAVQLFKSFCMIPDRSNRPD